MGGGKGLLIVNTGDGKGKTTASLGMALRAWGQGLRVLVIQFIKGVGWDYGERKAAEKLGPGLTIRPVGKGFIHESDETHFEQHRRAAHDALDLAVVEITNGEYDMIVLDEIFYAIHYKLVSLDDVMGLVNRKPEQLHLVLTGRYAPQEIIERADLVTEMIDVKHPFLRGINAQKGIEF
ncbi:MAG: cob(I)yrinic acid a,c-diamide adenosyltransferase [Desulfotomaculaceae bacterium]|nr:cob(I)yrinic acid a,c-diamide adenosyltransferase [Desulfotomaculaceae bacterium]